MSFELFMFGKARKETIVSIGGKNNGELVITEKRTDAQLP